MKQTTVHIPEGVAAVMDGAIKASGATLEIPVLSQADLTRLLLRDACDRLVEGDLMVEQETQQETNVTPDTLMELIDDNTRAKYLYKERKDDNWFVDMKGGFEGRVRSALEKRFGNGYAPSEAREFAKSYIGEAHDWWVKIEEDPETFERKKEFVLDRLEDYREMYDQTTYDPNEEFLQGFGGVQDGEEQASMESIEAEIEALARQRLINGNGVGHEELTRSIAMVYDVSEEAVAEIVDDVRREFVIAEQARASGLTDQSAPALMANGAAHDAHARSPDCNREDDEPDGIEMSEEEANELYGMTDGGTDRGDGPITDGGVDVPTVRDRIMDQLDVETIHGMTVSAKRDSTVYCLVAYTDRQVTGRGTHLRTVIVDLDAGTVKISKDNGLWWPTGNEVSANLTNIFARVSSDLSNGESLGSPVCKSTSDMDIDELLSIEMRADDHAPDRGTEGWGSEWGNGNGPPPEAYDFVDRLNEAGVRTDRFSRLDFGKKTPFERYAERSVSELLGNYAVEMIEDDPLIVVDVDYPEDAPIDELPDTYRVSSPNGSDDRAHHYYRVSDVDRVAEHFGTGAVKPGWGDVWLHGEYTVGPGSYHEETDQRYEIVNDVPITEISSDALIDLLERSWQGKEVHDPDDLEDDEDEDEIEEETSIECHDCGRELDREDAAMDLVEGSTVWICKGGCTEIVADGGRVQTQGVESTVYDEDEETIGHVVMLDYDDVDRETVVSDAEEIEGPTAILESSPGSWHLYGLAVRSWDEVVEIARSSNASTDYVDEMVRRGEFTLRIDAKGSLPAPSVWIVSARSDDRVHTVSRPHCSLLANLADSDRRLSLNAIAADLTSSHIATGELAVRSTYATNGGE